MAKVIKVAKDGTGNFWNLQDAIDSIPLENKSRTYITLSPGTYLQPIHIPKRKNLITITGVNPELTVITWYNCATKIEHHKPASLIGTGTFGCGSAIIEGDDFIAENVTFENNAREGSHQAVAVRVSADRCAFYNCRFLGFQDTLYLHMGKHYFKDCYIEGSVDFIFGNSTTLFEHCQIHCKAAGYVTAHSRTSSQETTGFVFLRCVITGTGGMHCSYLGRPWRPFSRVLFAFTYIDSCIKHEGWHNWGNHENEKTACFYEYKCMGPGSWADKRVWWGKQLSDREVEPFLSHTFIDPDRHKPWLWTKFGHRVPYSA
ncbi:unnamed protein product [Lactuca virosa]|uniref:Pectinesterase n=1 Tax=Lactuca virosa TaxID=75947 RepID=A0AAU9PWF8_9ASTR|nr:unnamed protein product [Lactuca virosa]